MGGMTIFLKNHYCCCNGSVDKILYQFISSSWSIHLIENWSTSSYPVSVSQLDLTSANIDQSQTNNKEVEQFWRRLINESQMQTINLSRICNFCHQNQIPFVFHYSNMHWICVGSTLPKNYRYSCKCLGKTYYIPLHHFLFFTLT